MSLLGIIPVPIFMNNGGGGRVNDVIALYIVLNFLLILIGILVYFLKRNEIKETGFFHYFFDLDFDWSWIGVILITLNVFAAIVVLTFFVSDHILK